MTLSEFFSSVGLRDVVDIGAVALVIYSVLLLIRGTRAVQILLGLLFFVGVWYLADVFGLLTLRTLFENAVIILPFAVIVVFRDEIRRALASFGSNPLMGLGNSKEMDPTVHEIVRAVEPLAARHVGALIVVERQEGLREYIENGTQVDGRVSSQLLVNLFTPGAPLHDGAVIVQGNRIAAAGCFLPLSRETDLAARYGTRHRAALGMSQESDAVAIVVSEETGQISLAYDGVLHAKLELDGLRQRLFDLLVHEAQQQPLETAISAGEG